MPAIPAVRRQGGKIRGSGSLSYRVSPRSAWVMKECLKNKVEKGKLLVSVKTLCLFPLDVAICCLETNIIYFKTASLKGASKAVSKGGGDAFYINVAAYFILTCHGVVAQGSVLREG